MCHGALRLEDAFDFLPQEGTSWGSVPVPALLTRTWSGPRSSLCQHQPVLLLHPAQELRLPRASRNEPLRTAPVPAAVKRR